MNMRLSATGWTVDMLDELPDDGNRTRSSTVSCTNSSTMYSTGADTLPSVPWVAGFISWSPSLNG
jgi:hypothetical protein